MKFSFTIEVEVERDSGKFASREEISEALVEAIEGANPDVVDGVGSDSESVYNIVEWSLS